VEERPVVAVLAREGQTRRDGERIGVDHIVAGRVAYDLLEAKVMDVVRSAADGLHPRRDLFAIVPVVVRVRVLKEGQAVASAMSERIIPRCASKR
jgi:hypothetical protein